MNLPHLNRLTGLRWSLLCNRRAANMDVLRGNAWITGALIRRAPCAIGKIGTTELMGMEYLDRWFQLPWPPSASWRRPARRLYECSGLFPVRKEIYQRWASTYREAVQKIDFIAQWQPEGTFLDAYEQAFLDRELPKAIRGNFHSLEPVGAPWLRPLADLRWLVISPFCQTISTQLHKLTHLNIFHGVPAESLARIAATCRLLPCPQFSYMVQPKHRDWLHGLQELQDAMSRETFDIAMIGAGAWSVPLAAHAKLIGKIGLHLGGTINLLFGIRGGRFEDRGLYNDHWIRPLPSECPTNHKLMENGAYW